MGGENFECIIIVVLEMGLSFFGIVFNLLVVATLRQEESIKGSTVNFLLFNLCFSNLVIAFLVKPISAIYMGYAVSSQRWEVGLAFCNLYTIVYGTTWCVFPFTLVIMIWCKVISRLRCFKCRALICSKKESQEEFVEVEESSSKHSRRTLEDGPTVKQKTLMSGIWILSLVFGLISCFQQRFLKGKKRSFTSGEEDSSTLCSVKTGINDVFDYIFLLVAFVVPMIFGPVFALIAQGIISARGQFICDSCSKGDPSSLENNHSKGPGWPLIGSLSGIFLFTYPVHMFLSETYFATDSFTFLVIKYVVGFLHILLIPLVTVHLEKDIQAGMQILFDGSVICREGARSEGRSSRSSSVISSIDLKSED